MHTSSHTVKRATAQLFAVAALQSAVDSLACVTLCAQHAATASQSNVVVVVQMRKARTDVCSCFDRTTASITTLLH
jgi:hypothetical protein